MHSIDRFVVRQEMQVDVCLLLACSWGMNVDVLNKALFTLSFSGVGLRPAHVDVQLARSRLALFHNI